MSLNAAVLVIDDSSEISNRSVERRDNLAVGVSLPDGTELFPIPVDGYLFVDSVMAAAADAPRGSGSGSEPAEPSPEDGMDEGTYHSCMASVRVSVLHCGDFLLWRLPDVPSCSPVPMLYAAVPSGLFGEWSLR